ncbi:MAG: hypothetical protein LBV33_06730 [Lachnospiraceae bacterium]|nr:hypothetical protein [Lachnospiraceae bacterium]
MDEKEKKIKINLHLVVLAIIVIVFGTAIFILVRWDKGVESDYDPSVVTTEFDVEEMDMLIPLEPAIMAEREQLDDGINTILCLGNNPFTDELGANGLAAQIAEKTGAEVINGGFPDSVIACRSSQYDPAYPQDNFSLYYVTKALVEGNFSALTAAAVVQEDDVYVDTVKNLESVDMNKVDNLIIMYDTTDYNTLSPGYDPADDYNLTAYAGALRTSLEDIREAFPYIRIYVMSHTYAQYLDENGQLHNGTIMDLGNGDLPHYLVLEYDTAVSCGVSFIDNYFGTINEGNYQEYMTDHMHYNDAGRELLAERIAAIINDE